MLSQSHSVNTSIESCTTHLLQSEENAQCERALRVGAKTGKYILLCMKKFTLGLLPPAAEGWRRYCFHRCMSVHREATAWFLVTGSFPGLCSHVLSCGEGRYPSPVTGPVKGPVSGPSRRLGGTPCPAWVRGYPCSAHGVPPVLIRGLPPSPRTGSYPPPTA